MAFALPFHPGPRVRRVLRYLGFTLLALVTFVFALQLTFPFDRVKDKIVEALSSKYEVQIGSVERGLMPGRMYFKAVTLRSRPDKPDDPVTTFYIQQLEVDVGLLALIGKAASIDLDATIGSGRLTGNVRVTQRHLSLDLRGENLPSASLPMRELIGLPMSGKLSFTYKMELPSDQAKSGRISQNWQKATGDLTLDCPSGCTIGDGKSKLRPKLTNARQQAFAEGGIEFGTVILTSLAAKVTIKDGLLTVTQFEAPSADGEVHIDLELALAPSISDSTANGCLRFKGSPALMAREPKTFAALTTTGADLREDGLFHIKLEGPLKTMKKRNAMCGPALKGGAMDDPSRPNLTVQPADETLTNKPTPVVPTPPPPAPADAAEATHTPPTHTGSNGEGGSADPSGAPTPTGEAVSNDGPVDGTSDSTTDDR